MGLRVEGKYSTVSLRMVLVRVVFVLGLFSKMRAGYLTACLGKLHLYPPPFLSVVFHTVFVLSSVFWARRILAIMVSTVAVQMKGFGVAFWCVMYSLTA